MCQLQTILFIQLSILMNILKLHRKSSKNDVTYGSTSYRSILQHIIFIPSALSLSVPFCIFCLASCFNFLSRYKHFSMLQQNNFSINYKCSFAPKTFGKFFWANKRIHYFISFCYNSKLEQPRKYQSTINSLISSNSINFHHEMNHNDYVQNISAEKNYKFIN